MCGHVYVHEHTRGSPLVADNLKPDGLKEMCSFILLES